MLERSKRDSGSVGEAWVASKVEIVAMIEQGTAQVQRIFGPLSDAQLRTRIHQGEGGWTAREVLAHLAARQPINDRLLQLAAGDGMPLSGNLNADEWNQTLVDERLDKTKDTLLAEFQAVQASLIARVEAMPDHMLAKPVPLPQGEMPLGDVLGLAGGMHAGGHAQEVEQALVRSATGE
jgi:DinB superfamily